MCPTHKKTTGVLDIPVILYISFALFGINFIRTEAHSSCIQAHPPVNDSAKNAACIFYNYTVEGGLCQNVITSLYVFGDNDTLAHGEKQTLRFQRFFNMTIAKISEKCKPIMIDLFCRYHFPPCDTSLDKPHARRICRKTCEYMDQDLCKEEMVHVRQAAEAAPVVDKDMINCALYGRANGGDAPECYEYYPLPGDDTKSTDCYYGVGVGYRGNVNVTRSGRSCQSWTSQCPHRHWRSPEDVADGQNDSNTCRNPDGSAPDGPWCYTADPKVRWEYCNVPRCPPRVPEEAPAFLQGYPVNATSIRIFWTAPPPSRHKEQLLGYRIKYRRLSTQLYKEVNVTSNFTEAFLKVVPHTTYEIEVNGFNEIGHGPAGEVLLVKSLSIGEVIIPVSFQFVIDEDFSTDLLNRSSSRFVALEGNLRRAIKRHFNKSSILKIYDVRAVDFRRGSVEAEIKVLTVVNLNKTNEIEARNHLTGGIESALKKSFNISAIIVLEKPQPPEDLKAINVQTKYIILSWNPPKHGDFYQIRNYTLEQKTEPSGNFKVIQTLSYPRTKTTIEDLKPSRQYSIRVSSNNKYGRSDGALITQSTLPDRFIRNLLFIIVLPVILAVLFVAAACVKVRPTRKSGPDKYEDRSDPNCFFQPSVNGMTVHWVRGDWLELPRSDITLLDKLGEGAFGEAYKGLVRVDGQWRECAVKKLKESATEVEKRDLMNELQIMVTVGEHPNVISLIGACTSGGPILVVVRLAVNGSLLQFLTKNRDNPYINVEQKQAPFTHIDKVKIARDIANGMLHLATKKCIHRDLAARNILLGENNVAMVSDFGLSRDVYESGEYESTSGGMLPVRWMAPESLEDYTYNNKTDVWSFGVVLWEIETLGKMPYSGLGGMEVVDYLKAGHRLKQPDECPDKIYEIMMSCWCPDPSQRPSFSELVTSLEKELENIGRYISDKNNGIGSQGGVITTEEGNDQKGNDASAKSLQARNDS